VATYSDNFLANKFAFQISSAKVTKGITCVINVMNIHIESEKIYHPF